jgi:hypothetical protein
MASWTDGRQLQRPAGCLNQRRSHLASSPLRASRLALDLWFLWSESMYWIQMVVLYSEGIQRSGYMYTRTIMGTSPEKKEEYNVGFDPEYAFYAKQLYCCRAR